MLKTIFSFCIIGALGLLVVSFYQPERANQFVDRVLGVFVAQPILEIPGKVVTPERREANIFYPFIKSSSQGSEGEEQSAAQTETSGTSLTIQNVIALTNQERIKEGLPPLSTNTKLNSSATLKVDDMVKLQYFEHTSPSGKGVSDLGSEVGYAYVVMGENLALGNFSSAKDLVTAWMNSPGHRANIMNSSYREIGVSLKKANYQGREVWFAVQHFGTTRAVCPIIDQSLKSHIDAMNVELKKRESQIVQKRAQLENSDYETNEEYQKDVAAFNALVKAYNTLLAESQKNIASYNAQVSAFNKCLATYQKPKAE